MKKLLKVTMIVSFVIALSGCGKMGDLIPLTSGLENDTSISSTD